MWFPFASVVVSRHGGRLGNANFDVVNVGAVVAVGDVYAQVFFGQCLC